MKRSEFLSQLREALEHDLSADELKKNIDYYDEYIKGEMQKGQSEEEVITSLGDPWAIAKTIRMSTNMGGTEYTSDPEELKQEVQRRPNSNATTIIVIVAIVAILILVLSLIFGIIALVIRFAFPILLIVLIFKIFSKKR